MGLAFFACRGTASQNETYCTKNAGAPSVQLGTIPADDPKSGNWELYARLARDEGVSGIPARYYVPFMRSFDTLASRGLSLRLRAQRDEALGDVVLKLWQQTIVDIIRGPICPRTIYWVYDPVGNAGKTFLCDVLERSYPDRVQTLHLGRAADVLAAIQPGRAAYIFDVPRSLPTDCDLSTLESIKDGRIFRSKYQSEVCVFPRPHVFVFANRIPPENQFSADRIVVSEV
jgi:hypothetical protein